MFTSHVLMATMTFVNPSAMMEAVSDAWLQLYIYGGYTNK